jgi:hypothetical protein
MTRNLGSFDRLKAFLRKLAVALPVNLAVAWFLFNGQQTATLAVGIIAAAAGSLLAMALEPRLSHEPGTSSITATVQSGIGRQSSPAFDPTFHKGHHA